MTPEDRAGVRLLASMIALIMTAGFGRMALHQYTLARQAWWFADWKTRRRKLAGVALSIITAILTWAALAWLVLEVTR